MKSSKPQIGMKALKQEMIDLKADQHKFDEQIKEYENKIEEIKRSDAKNSPKYPLLTKNKELNLTIKELLSNRKECYDKMEEITDAYEDLGQKHKEAVRYMSTEAIDKRLKDINMEMLKFPCSTQQSKVFENEIKDLKIKKQEIENEQKKFEIIKQAQEKYYALKDNVRELSKQISELKKEINNNMDQIKALDSIDQKMNPQVESLQKNITELKNKKLEMKARETVLQQEISKKREEYNIFQQKKVIQEAYEKKKKEILEKIQEFEKQKEKLGFEKTKCDSSKFDSLIFFLGNMKGNSNDKITFPIDVAMSLSQFKIRIPSQFSQIPLTIDELKIKKIDFVKDVAVRIKELDEEIGRIDEAIKKEKGLLINMPPVDVNLPSFNTKQSSD